MTEEFEKVLMVYAGGGVNVPLSEFVRSLPVKTSERLVVPSWAALKDQTVSRAFRIAEAEVRDRLKTEQEALDLIAESIEARQPLNRANVAALSADVLNGIREWGQGYLVARANPKPYTAENEPCPAEIVTGRCSRPVCRCWPQAGRAERGRERTLER
jgi:hypothetical protein